MKTDGPVYRNPVVLSEPVYVEQYTSLLTSLPEYRFKNRIVGFTPQAAFVCTRRNAKSGYYEMVCEPIPWSHLEGVRCGRFFSKESVVLGVAMMVIGLALLDMGWIRQTHTGPAVYWMPFAAPIASLWLIFGSKRFRIMARSDGRKVWWVAPPFFKGEEELRANLGEAAGLECDKDAD